MKVKILAHGVDPDGIISHALIERYHLPSEDIEHYYIDYPDLTSTLHRLSQVRNDRSRVYFADINFGPEVLAMGEKLFHEIKTNNGSIAWFDHHDGSINHRGFLERFCYPLSLSSGDCASKIIARNLLGGVDEYANSLAQISQAHDFRIESDVFKLGEQLQDLIRFRSIGKRPNKELDELVRLIANEKSWDVNWKLNQDLLEEVTMFKDMKEGAYKELFSNAEIYVVEDKKIVVAYTPHILYLKDGPFYLQTKFGFQADYFISIFDDNNGSIMVFGKPGLIEDDLALIRFCGSKGGGGRGNGGGFHLGEHITAEEYSSVRYQILESFGEALKML